MMAARVGAFEKGTATRCVQLARLSPVMMYRMMNSPALVFLKMKCWKMTAATSQATKYRELMLRCHDLYG